MWIDKQQKNRQAKQDKFDYISFEQYLYLRNSLAPPKYYSKTHSYRSLSVSLPVS